MSSSVAGNAGTDRHLHAIFLNGKTDHPAVDDEFRRLERDTIVGEHYKNAVIMLVERLSKVIITLKTEGQESKEYRNGHEPLVSDHAEKRDQVDDI